jgi:hypothetical protein
MTWPTVFMEFKFSPTWSSLKHPYHVHGNQPCNWWLDPEPITPQTESASIIGSVPQVLPQLKGGFGSPTTSWRRIWIVYDKLEEDLDRLLQAGGEVASIHQRAPRPRRLLWLHQRCLFVPPSWSGGSGHWKGMSPPSYPAQPTFLRLHLDRAG